MALLSAARNLASTICRAILIAIGLVLAGCGDEADSSPQPPPEQAPTTTQAPTPTQTTPPLPSPAPARSGTLIKAASSEFGTILFDATGQAIYLFDKERSTRPECYDACAEAWPPALTKGVPAARGAVKQALLGTDQRTDCTTAACGWSSHPRAARRLIERGRNLSPPASSLRT